MYDYADLEFVVDEHEKLLNKEKEFLTCHNLHCFQPLKSSKHTLFVPNNCPSTVNSESEWSVSLRSMKYRDKLIPKTA